jgi:hypothetical protein
MAAKKLNVKEKLDEDRLDLSMCDLVTVPIKEIVEVQKARKLNLSFNNLIHLPVRVYDEMDLIASI